MSTRAKALILCQVVMVLAITIFFPLRAQDSGWEPVAGAETLRDFMSGLTTERDLPGKEVARGEYHEDGTGVLHEWGASFSRTWEVAGEDQVCITVGQQTKCYQFERHDAETNFYRARDVETDQRFEFRVTGTSAVATGPSGEVGSTGGAATASAEEIAAELANPNTPMGTLSTNFDYIAFDGDLAEAGDQSAVKMVFQPSLPYPLGGGTNFFVRPAIPVIFDQSVPNPDGGFDSKGVELGDIAFDAAFGFSFKREAGANVLIAGLTGTIPTATDDALGLDQWLLGPEIALAMVRKWGAIGILATHQWDVAGESSFGTSLTGGQYFYTFNLTGGWQISAGPNWSFNHKASSENAWTFPLGIGVAKTSVLGGRPWKMSFQYWNFIEAPEAFGPKHQVRFVIGPVVKLPWKGRG